MGFVRVEGEQAGPAALGILVPPGRRTFVILRPRSLPWDVVLCRDTLPPVFVDLAHDEASACVQAIWRGLRDWQAGASGVIEAIETERGFLVRLALGPNRLVVCTRLPGKPYAPLIIPHDEALQVIEKLRPIIQPSGDQEIYFNLRFFERQTPGE